MEEDAISDELVLGFTRARFGDKLHDKRCRSVAYWVLGVIHGGELTVAGVGRGLAQARGKSPKHCIKQVDRLLSNEDVSMDIFFAGWVPWLIGDRDSVVAALDWTEHAHDSQSTIALFLVTRHGRATPMIWKTVDSGSLKDNRNRYEDELLAAFTHCIPPDLKVTILADRGFGDVAFYDVLEELGFDYVVRFRSCIEVRLRNGAVTTAADLVAPNGRAKSYPNVELTAQRRKTPALVTVRADRMKEAWCLATSLKEPAQQVVELYGRRFTIEETFRDAKDAHFGLGLSQTHIGNPVRRDRLLMLAAMAHALLTLLGRAGESIGLDRQIRANTVKRRTHSLFRQGREYLKARLRGCFASLHQTFLSLLQQQQYLSDRYAWL